MSWKCEKCGQKLSGKEKFCPECGNVPVYKCKDCEKELENGRSHYCPTCKLKRQEKRKEAIGNAGKAVAGVAAVAVTAITTFARRK